MGYSDFQTRQVFVANARKASFAELADPGDIFVGKTQENEIFLQHVGALGHKMRSDLIPVAAATVTATASDSDVVKLRGWKVTLNPDVNGGSPVNGVLYDLHVHMTNYIGIGDGNTYDKYGQVVGKDGITPSDFYKELAFSLVQNESKDPDYLYCVYLVIGGEETFVDRKLTLKQVLALGDATGVVVYEAPQRWDRLRFPQTKVPVTLFPQPAWVGGEKVQWWTIEEVDSDHVLPQGQRVAELEAHAIPERGDVYNGVGWPDVAPTLPLVDASKEYDIVNIHYYWQGTNEAVQKSEKDIQIICVNDGSHTVANAVIADINTASGLGISTLSAKKG